MDGVEREQRPERVGRIDKKSEVGTLVMRRSVIFATSCGQSARIIATSVESASCAWTIIVLGLVIVLAGVIISSSFCSLGGRCFRVFFGSPL